MDVFKHFFDQYRRYAVISGALVIVVLVLSALMLPAATWAQGGAGDPWVCNGDAYVTQGNGDYSYLSVVDPTTSPWSLNNLPNYNPAGLDLNALGYNPVDNYLYATDPGGPNAGHVYRLGQAGGQYLGTVALGDEYWFAGTFVYDYDASTGTASDAKYVIARDTLEYGNYGNPLGYPYVVMDVSGNSVSTLEQGYLQHIYKDFVYNPQDGMIYGIAEGNPDIMYKIDPNNNYSETPIGSGTGQNYGAYWAAAFADSSGALYFYNIYNSQNVGSSPIGFYRAAVDASGNLTGELIFVSPAGEWTRSDGANCPLHELDINMDFGDLPDQYHTTLADNGPRHLIQDDSPILGGDIDQEQDGQPNTGATGDDDNNVDDEDGVNRIAGLGSGSGGWTNGTVASGNGGALQITVGQAPGVVQVWMDLDGDGALDEVPLLDSSGAPISQPMAIGSHTVYFDIPPGHSLAAQRRKAFTPGCALALRAALVLTGCTPAARFPLVKSRITCGRAVPTPSRSKASPPGKRCLGHRC